jgi:pimeloyl-ACP methyl ester carboxylesterase
MNPSRANTEPRVGARFPEGWRALVPPEWIESWRPEGFDLEGGATEVVTMGGGPPLLLLPPLPGYKEAFVALAWRLARWHRVVTFDLRARFAGRPSWGTLLADLERVADRYLPGRAAVIGHSLGAALAQRWALAHPERVSALVLSSPFARVAGARGHAWKRYAEQPLVLASLRWLPEPWAAALSRDLARRGVWVFDDRCQGAALDLVRFGIRRLPLALGRDAVALAFAHDLRAELPRITTPTLLVVGERESAWARAAEAEVAALLPAAERRESPGAAHLHPLSSPEWLAEAVHEWLAARTTLPGD